MKSQKGQDIVEFALLLPVFLVIICGIMYVGFFFGDYMTLNNIARSAAREATVIEEVTKNGQTESVNNYDKIAKNYGDMIYEAQQHHGDDSPNKKTFITSLYLYQPSNPMTVKGPGEHIFPGGPEDSVEVVIPMVLNENAAFVQTLSKLGILSSEPYNIIYYMYDETYQKSS